MRGDTDPHERRALETALQFDREHEVRELAVAIREITVVAVLGAQVVDAAVAPGDVGGEALDRREIGEVERIDFDPGGGMEAAAGRRYRLPASASTSAAEIIAAAFAGAGRSAGRNTSSPRWITWRDSAQVPVRCAKRRRQRCSP